MKPAGVWRMQSRKQKQKQKQEQAQAEMEVEAKGRSRVKFSVTQGWAPIDWVRQASTEVEERRARLGLPGRDGFLYVAALRELTGARGVAYSLVGSMR
ncbi:hypothetical protein CCMA1212_006047 [Trichoderma ghanense]|uniref:Uncharacterized protein n=1 Tax=Trichoderma ghanense TaxID=65468 RepID=A0ABY2H385_9HYPO